MGILVAFSGFRRREMDFADVVVAGDVIERHLDLGRANGTDPFAGSGAKLVRSRLGCSTDP